ncbi:coq9 [Candida pseudojiufengensis]|uniref:coq9 n=1 Tax=Candida pseudojiufengensis TaxID=497109 RepID=UPI002225AD75|nr:coq9 [Candida pseudojiufengensis]KAI5961904.1 coq9 [Candida pseudojiufengensis]
MFNIIRPRLVPSLKNRFYHSSSHPGTNNIINENIIESRILNKAVEYIPKYGFNSTKPIINAIKDLNYSDSITSLFTSNPNGNSLPFQLTLYWLKLKRLELDNFAKTTTLENNQYSNLQKLIIERLSYNEPVISKLQEAMSLLILPYNITQSIEELMELSDDLTYYSGDKSNDFNWYSKRFCIGSIYLKSELFMLKDTSYNFEMTKLFVNEKLKEYENLSNGIVNFEQWCEFNAIGLVNLIKSQLIRG